jgi:hypothetical protein
VHDRLQSLPNDVAAIGERIERLYLTRVQLERQKADQAGELSASMLIESTRSHPASSIAIQSPVMLTLLTYTMPQGSTRRAK